MMKKKIDTTTRPTLSELLDGMEGVSVTDEQTVRIKAATAGPLGELLAAVYDVLQTDHTVTVSPIFGNASTMGCVWQDIKVKPHKKI